MIKKIFKKKNLMATPRNQFEGVSKDKQNYFYESF